MRKGHLGDRTILEIGIGLIEQKAPNLPNDLKTTLIQTTSDFLKHNIQFSQANEIFMNILGQNDIIERLKEVLTVPDEPIAFNGEDEENSSSSRRKMRTWSTYEDTRLLSGIYRYGIDNWAPISKFIGNGRTRAQCAQRWARGLNPRICKDTWDPQEDMLLLHLVQKFGDRAWTRISSSLGNRSDVQCRYHYHQLTKDMPHLVQLNQQNSSTQSNYPFPNFNTPIQLVPINSIQNNLPPPRYSLPAIPINLNNQLTENTQVLNTPNFDSNFQRRSSQLNNHLPVISNISKNDNDQNISNEKKMGLDDFLIRFK